MKTIKQFLSNEDGATAIEYGLIAALVSVAAIGAMQTLGTSLDSMFGKVSGNLSDAESNAASDSTTTDTTTTDTTG